MDWREREESESKENIAEMKNEELRRFVDIRSAKVLVTDVRGLLIDFLSTCSELSTMLRCRFDRQSTQYVIE